MKLIKLFLFQFILLSTIVAFPQGDGALDLSFDSSIGSNQTINTIVQQPDGKVLIGGNFTSYNGVSRNYIARLNTNGSLDNTFNPGSGLNRQVTSMVLQPDGKIIIADDFSSYNGIIRRRIARVNTDGSLDTTFNPGLSTNMQIYSVSLQSDLKIIITGPFSSYNGVSRPGIARLNSDGSLDTSFIVGSGFGGSLVWTSAIQSDGKILVGGSFFSYNGSPANGIVRLNTDGSLDSSLDSSQGVNNAVYSIIPQNNSKILIGGLFTTCNGISRNRLARLNFDGSLDLSFDPGLGANAVINNMAQSLDGKIIIGGVFTSYDGVTSNRIARINSNGSLDIDFVSGTGFNSVLTAVTLQNDNKIIAAGYFTSYQGITRNSIARINNTIESVLPEIEANSCNSVLSSSTNEYIYASEVAGATSYEFQITNGLNVQSVVKNTNSFRFDDLGQGNFTFGTIYSISVRVEINGQWSPYSLPCTVSIVPSISPQSFCGTATVANLIATGTALQWYTTQTGGMALTSNTVLNTATYYVSQTVNGIESTRSGVVITVNPSVTPTFPTVSSICSGETLAALPTTSIEGVTGTWSPALNNLATTTYTFTSATGQCAASTSLTITVNPSITPTFTAVDSICSGETLLPLPTTSLNGIDGSWWPVLNNTATTTYTFRPKPDQCAAEITVTITVNSPAIPTFTAVVPICSGEMLAALPTTSLDGFTGTWSPALNNWATTTYTFTPAVGQCATTATMTIVVTPVVLPNFTPVSPICAGSILTALPTTSTNGITGTWSPALNNTTTTFYIFTPTAGQCAKKVELLIKVLPNKSPNFNPVPPICLGKTLAPLPTTSLDGYTGTWSPALNNTVTTTYTFTPTVGQCAVPVTMTIVVDPPTLGGVVSGGTTICRSSTSGVLTLSGHVGIIVRWESSTNNFVTKTNINNNTTTHISGPLTTTTQFRAVIQGICGEGFSTSTTVTPVVVLSPAALRLTDNAISPLTAITDVSRYIGTSVPLTLTATTVSGATSYEWEFPAGVNQLSGGTSNTVTIDFAGVGPGATSLYLGAKARNGDCISTRNNSTLIPATFSTARLLRISANIPATPSALKLTDDAISTSLGINNVSRYIGTTVPLTLTANVSVNANSYDWELPAGVTQLSGGNTNIISVNFAGVGAGVTSLYLGAVARNGVGVSIRNNSSLVPVTTSTASLLKVTASVPRTVASVTGQIVGICGGSTYNYAITPSVLATSYIITAPAGSIVTSVNNPLNVTNTLSTSDLMFSVLYPTNLASLTPKTLVITAVNGVGSNLTDRTLNILTTMPSIGAATGSEGITTFQRCSTQTFTVPAIVGATSYIWEVINGAAIVGASNTNTVEVDFSLVPIFSTTNLVKVRAVNACGIFSNVRNITLRSIPCTVLRGATKEIKNTYNDGPIMGMANMYPNPTSGAFKLDLEMLAKGQVDIEIYASNAGLIKTNKGVHLEKGTNTIEMDISNLAIGVYMVRITNTTTDEVLVKRIIKE